MSVQAKAGAVGSNRFDLYYEEVGEGLPILLIPPAGSTASTWGAAAEELARIGRVIAYETTCARSQKLSTTGATSGGR